MADKGQGSWNGEPADQINIEIDLTVLASKLAKDPAFIDAISSKVRKQLTKDVRWLGNLFGKWAGR
jgi:hypothetical protein